MHISEGVLSAPVLAGGAVLAVAATAVGLRKLDGEDAVRAGVLAAAFFAASLVHLPIGPASIHLVLSGLMGALLGWAAFPAILVGLALQALMFQYGGVTVLGVNAVVMGLPAVAAGLAARPLLRRSGPAFALAAFGCGALAILGSLALLYLALVLSGDALSVFAGIFFWSHLALMGVEGAITLFILGFLKRMRPELLA
ncbi:Cobalt transport protein CbiM [Fundidesulfovibrio magnetotacticus]|uniref:Cobalt transport protein CbiM n=1 Tax=Fundidesulfovibrio magnetotacticus TaxID=2730080 RepID=A0A6V8LVM4_9BACT|nr:cobalt transporter CbiM [Fundidesulfovibrio magnetotacticus]GFK94641.1 Cobalt transport protein CbiM [Fundidesulfovibrio magnetotacticus]